MIVQIQGSAWLLSEIVGVSVTGDTVELFFKALPTESQEFIFASATDAQVEAERIITLWVQYFNRTTVCRAEKETK